MTPSPSWPPMRHAGIAVFSTLPNKTNTILINQQIFFLMLDRMGAAAITNFYCFHPFLSHLKELD